MTSLVDQRIPDWLVKIVFLGEAERAVWPDIKAMFGVMGFSTSKAVFSLIPCYLGCVSRYFMQEGGSEICVQITILK